MNRTLWDLLREIDRLHGRLDALGLPEAWVEMARARALVEEAFHTTRIEGSEITREEAEAAFAGENVPSARADDLRELLNFRAAHRLAGDYAESGRPFTQAFLREIHRELVRGVRGGAAAPGEYRKVQNYVVNQTTGETIYTPPPANEVPERMAALVDQMATGGEHPIIVSGVAHLDLVDIHPFLDGNGRTGRLLAVASLTRDNYAVGVLGALSAYYDADRASYYDAIQSTRTADGDATRWLEYFARGIHAELGQLLERTERAWESAAKVDRRLSDHEQRALALAASGGGVTIRQLEQAVPGVPRRTLQYAVRRLVDAGLLLPQGETNSRRYVVATPTDKAGA